jgi:capsular polysaccharide biosynthesis protein
MVNKENVIYNLYREDTNGRDINIHKVNNVKLVGDDLYYPNCLFYSLDSSKVFKPINESIMSLLKNKDNGDGNYNIDNSYDKVVTDSLFFFIYNTDNYYHFVYDTLPYLISFFEIKKNIKDLKLLMNYPNTSKTEHYKFVIEFLEILGINSNDIIIGDKKTLYNEIYFSTSYTHDSKSNLPPRKEIYDFYQKIVNKIKSDNKINNLPKKIYVSRRSWIHGDLSNIGTNYTSRRKLINEDELVKNLEKLGYKEIFTEKLSTVEKVLMFSEVESVIGAIGGGLCNVLFSNKNTKLYAIISPTFLDVNYRFKYSFSNVNTTYFNETKHVESDEYKKFMRVKVNNIIGEIEDIDDNNLLISYTEQKVAGWNNEVKTKKILVKKEECEILDNGLNSAWVVNIPGLLNIL